MHTERDSERERERETLSLNTLLLLLSFAGGYAVPWLMDGRTEGAALLLNSNSERMIKFDRVHSSEEQVVISLWHTHSDHVGYKHTRHKEIHLTSIPMACVIMGVFFLIVIDTLEYHQRDKITNSNTDCLYRDRHHRPVFKVNANDRFLFYCFSICFCFEWNQYTIFSNGSLPVVGRWPWHLIYK